MADDDRKPIQLQPDVKQRFDARKPDGLSQSEFVDLLLDVYAVDGAAPADVKAAVREVLAESVAGH